MTRIKTKINGEEWEISIDDGLTVEFEEGKLTVRKAAESIQGQQLIPMYPFNQPYWPLNPYPNTVPDCPFNPYPITGTITTNQPIGQTRWTGGCW